MGTPRVTHEPGEGPQSKLKRKYIQEYLRSKGACLESLSKLPQDEQRRLMCEASQSASLKLAEVESRAKFRHDIHTPS